MDSSRRDFLAAGMALPAAGALQKPAPLAPQLRTRVLGKTGLKVTHLGFGCMITSDPSVIERAADLGITYFDTARVYQGGNNERMVGAALKSRRKNLVLSTKTVSRDKAGALRDLESSLRELQTDYVDIWYLHSKREPADITDDLLEAQRTARQQGKIRFAGISNHAGHAELIPAVIRHKEHFDVLLTSYNFTMGNSADRVIQAAHQAGIATVGMKVMAGGYRVMPFYPTTDRTREIMHRPGAIAAALKWVLKNPNIDTTIPSMVDMDQLDENIRAAAAPFTGDDEKALSARLEFLEPIYCRMCGECTGKCPQGVPVADVLRFLTYAEGYGQFAMARSNYLELPASIQQARCDLCPTCSIECPNGVRVRQRVARAQELFAV